MKKSTLSHAAAWIGTSVAVIFGMKYTGSTWCLWALLLPAITEIGGEM